MQNRIRNSSERKINPTIKIYTTLFKVAATLLVLFALSYLVGYVIGKTETIKYTAATNMKYEPIVLADGSKVYLNKGAQISYPKKFNSKTRIIKLTGEAFFEVARNEKQPFVIQTKAANIQVLGTSFNVLACNNCDSIQVDVKTGLVELSSSHNANKILIPKGNTGVYYIAQNQLKLSTTDINMNRFAWKTDSIIFQDSRLSFVAKTLERIFGEKIIINSEKLKQCPITADFKEQDLQQILKSIEVSHGLHVNKTNKGYILTGTECK
jgi:ferric-dicitrate binding protein FerR (iron transport regulator)